VNSSSESCGEAVPGSFAAFVRGRAADGELVVQPRMGFATTQQMRAGLLAVRAVHAPAVGTITLDSYTRLGDHASADHALRRGTQLNGFPLVVHGAQATRRMLDGVVGPQFPVQVRHGSSRPYDIFATLLEAGIEATEGGPVSYCLPYSRTPLADSVDEWRRSCELLRSGDGPERAAHLESFGGCLLGQLCPPGLLVAVSLLEGLFFARCGVRSLSLSYAQQPDEEQNVEAVAALRALASHHLPDLDWHVVLYTYMGVYPRTWPGAMRLLASSARLAVRTGAERLVVKTVAEAHGIPTVADNLHSLRLATDVAAAERTVIAESGGTGAGSVPDTGILAEATALVGAVLALHDDVGTALRLAFRDGLLDVPYCLHPDNHNESQAALGEDGRLRWVSTGRMPIAGLTERSGARAVSAASLLEMLTHVERSCDGRLPHRSAPLPVPGRGDH